MRGGITPLIAAAQCGNLECVQLLLSARADIYAIAMGKTAVQHARAAAQHARASEGGWSAIAATLDYAEKTQAHRDEAALVHRQAEALHLAEEAERVLAVVPGLGERAACAGA
eukprot:388796-Prymnesium_polylepis.1